MDKQSPLGDTYCYRKMSRFPQTFKKEETRGRITGWRYSIAEVDTCDVSLVIDIKRARIVNGTLGTTYSVDTSKTDGDISDNDLQDVFNTLRDGIKLSVDTHWDCYCKRTRVCGCGCDPKHDG